MSGPSAYSHRPLAAKLGVRAGSRLLLDGAPPEFDLGQVPADVVVHRRPTSYALAFVVRLRDR